MNPPSPLVSTAWLAERLGDPAIKPLDASWWFPSEARNGAAEFEAVHIPGAAFFDIDAVADQASPLPHMLPAPDAFAGALGVLGVGDGDMVVAYETGAPRSAARLWWSLRAMGHKQVVVLDGGLPRWLAEDRPTAAGPARPVPARFTPQPDPAMIAAAADIPRAPGAVQVCDARPADRFRGEAPEPREGLAPGHMPGALSLPAGSLYDASGLMLAPDALRARLAAASVDPHRRTIATCGSGITACNIALALAVLGRWDVAVYDGSWAEWGALAGAAVVQGEA